MAKARLKMIVKTLPYTTRHPELLRSNSKYNQPVGVAKVLNTISDPNCGEFECLVQKAFDQIGVQIKKDEEVTVDYLTSGRFSHIFQVSLRSDSPIMQVSRGSSTIEAGTVVEKDFRNLTWLNTLGSSYFPRTFSAGRMKLHGIDDVPITFAEFFGGYWEVNCTDYNMGPCNFFTKNPEYSKLDKQTSIFIMEQIVKILSYVFVRTYDGATNTGMLIHGVCIDSGDFLYKKDQSKEGPLVRMITARELDPCTPREFLFYLLSPFEVHPVKNRKSRYVLNEFRASSDRDSTCTIIRGIRGGIAEAGGSVDELIERWTYDAQANLRDDLDKLGIDISENNVQSLADIKPGYRTFVKLKSFLMEDKRRNLPVIIPTGTCYNEAWESQRANIPSQLKIAGERVLSYLK